MSKLLLVAVIAGCGGPRLETVADACYEFASTICARFVQCGLDVGPIAQCRSDGVKACCSTECGRPIADLQRVYDCDAAFKNETCGQFSAGLTPNVCLGK